MSINHKNIILTTLVCAALASTAATAGAAADTSALDAAENASAQASAQQKRTSGNLHDLPLHWESVEHPLQNKATAGQAKAMPIIITAEDVRKAEKAAAQRAKEQTQAPKPTVTQPLAPPKTEPVAPPPVQAAAPPLPAPTIAPEQENVAPSQTTSAQRELESVELAITPLQPEPSAAVAKKEIIVELPPIEPLTAEQKAQPTKPTVKKVKQTVELPPVELFGTSRTVEIEVEAVEPAEPVAPPATKANSTVELQLQPLN